MNKQPEYYNLDIKVQAREKNAKVYRELTGNFSIPNKKQYWTLANFQPPDHDGTEIVQMKKIGLIRSDSQFFGVDFDSEIIKKNKEWHPKANWINAYWEDGIRSVDNFNPAFIYLDMTSFVSTEKVLYAINSTMHLCRVKTLFLVNLMLNDPRSSRVFDGSYILSYLPKVVPSLELSKWRREVNSFVYSATGVTEMKTFIFLKERA